MALKLYEIKNEYLSAVEDLNSINELSDEIIKDTLAPFKQEVEAKITNIAAYIKNLEIEAAAMKQYEDNMNKKRKVVENKILRIKEYIKSNMIECEINKISSPEFNIQIRPCTDSVVIDDESKLHDVVMNVKVIRTPDKNKIKNMLNEGWDVPGAHLESGWSLVIK
jgi:hypothetical protein